MPPSSGLVRAAAACLFVLAAHATAAAQPPVAFYRGNTIHLAIGGAAGSDEDIYGRLVAKYLGRHIAGNPAVAVADMPGSGGHVAAGYIYSSAAKDGTAIGEVPSNILTRHSGSDSATSRTIRRNSSIWAAPRPRAPIASSAATRR